LRFRGEFLIFAGTTKRSAAQASFASKKMPPFTSGSMLDLDVLDSKPLHRGMTWW
jgi:hypothetical protein